MVQMTLVLFVEKSVGVVDEVLLAMKKRGFGQGWWNAPGGKVQEGESIEQAAIRECSEEVGMKPVGMDKAAEIIYRFETDQDLTQIMHVFISEQWNGEPVESEEMAPVWFRLGNIPYSSMWPSDRIWLPRVLSGEKLTGEVVHDTLKTVRVENYKAVSKF